MRSRRRLALMLLPLVYLLACLGLPRGVAAQSSNIILNAGWEENGVWGYAGCAQYEIGRTGNRSIAAGCAGNTGQTTIRQSVTLVSGQQYRLSVWVMFVGTIPSSTLRLIDGNTSIVASANCTAGRSSLNDWEECAVLYTAPSTSSTFTVEIANNGCSGCSLNPVRYDDAALETFAPPPTQVPTVAPQPTSAPVDDTAKPCYKAAQALSTLLGSGGRVDYCWGSNVPNVYQANLVEEKCPTGTGLDCSGSFLWAYKQAGKSIPDMTAATLKSTLQPVAGCTYSNLASCVAIGDAIFVGSPVYHIAMVVGISGGVVQIGDCFNTGVGRKVHAVTAQAVYQSEFAGVGRPSTTYGWEPCTPANGDASGGSAGGGGGWLDIWAPIRWLADKIAGGFASIVTAINGLVQQIMDGLKALFIPSETDWEEIAAALQPLYMKEPIGTIVDVSNFGKTLHTGITNINPDATITGDYQAGPSGVYGTVFAGLTVSSVVNAASTSLESLAAAMGSWVVFFKLLTSALLFWGLWLFFRDEVQLTA